MSRQFVHILPHMRTYREVMDLWPSRAELASDVGKTEEAVRKWSEREYIPSSSWPEVSEAAAKRHYPVDLQLLASLRDKKPRKKPGRKAKPPEARP